MIDLSKKNFLRIRKRMIQFQFVSSLYRKLPNSKSSQCFRIRKMISFCIILCLLGIREQNDFAKLLPKTEPKHPTLIMNILTDISKFRSIFIKQVSGSNLIQTCFLRTFMSSIDVFSQNIPFNSHGAVISPNSFFNIQENELSNGRFHNFRHRDFLPLQVFYSSDRTR